MAPGASRRVAALSPTSRAHRAGGGLDGGLHGLLAGGGSRGRGSGPDDDRREREAGEVLQTAEQLGAFLAHHDELLGQRIVVEDFARRDLEDPAVHLELPLLEALGDEVEGPQVFELDEDVLLDGSGRRDRR